MPRGKKYDVFLSHNSVDKPWVGRLKDALQSHGVKVWLDRDEIRPGDLFIDALEIGLEKSKSVALIVSPEALDSDWVKEEYHRALTLAHDKKQRLQLIPVILREAKLPGFLITRNSIDFSDESVFNESLNRLIWGITNKRVTDSSTKVSETHSHYRVKVLPSGQTVLIEHRISLPHFEQELSDLIKRMNRWLSKLHFASEVFEHFVKSTDCDAVKRRLNKDYEPVHKFIEFLEVSDDLPLKVVPARFELMNVLKSFDIQKMLIDEIVSQFLVEYADAFNQPREERSKIRRQLEYLLRLRKAVLDEAEGLYSTLK